MHFSTPFLNRQLLFDPAAYIIAHHAQRPWKLGIQDMYRSTQDCFVALSSKLLSDNQPTYTILTLNIKVVDAYLMYLSKSSSSYVLLPRQVKKTP